MAGERSHGRKAYVGIDDLAGALQNVSPYFMSVDWSEDAEREETHGFGTDAVGRQALGLRKNDVSVSGWFAISANARHHGRRLRLLIDEHDMASLFTDASLKLSCQHDEDGGFGEDFERHQAPGHVDATLSLQGFYRVGSGWGGKLAAALAADPESAQLPLVSWAPNGYAPTRLVELIRAAATKNTSKVERKTTNTASAEISADDGASLGVSLQDLVPVATAALPIVSATPVDEGGATNDGGIGQLHVTAFTGTNLTLKLRHSVDNVTYVDLATFTVVAGVGSQRIVVPEGTTVNRWLRWEITAGTFTSVTFHVAFARRGFTLATAGTYKHLRGMLQSAATQTFRHGPEGNATGKEYREAEVRLSGLDLKVTRKETITFSATLAVDGGSTTATF